ncbi:hypothetical protein NP493_587g00021 [Ridgeia piscesae]|uniref:Schwannomin interacting protein 1 C-terminal domain-containing protein n=1 Tax=Ridgeia piscesae TaxID=27915 RepID=A0AAD9KUD8_RIDPI|nr:hypothetical protein NP493_587g00021 [Ridgeia piscesae]
MGFDEDYYGGERVVKKPSLQTRLQGGMNLQICFVNEAALADQNEAGGASLDASQVAPSQSLLQPTEPAPPSGAVAPPVGHTQAAARSEKKTKKKKKKEATEDEDLVARQARLQAEATMALAQVRPMAHMQLEVEKQLRKKSPIAEIVGIPGVGDGTRVRFGRQRLEQMNVARLQVILNDLHTQIENLNEELVQMLVERDDLHMEQDSKLVDIEDLTRYGCIIYIFL